MNDVVISDELRENVRAIVAELLPKPSVEACVSAGHSSAALSAVPLFKQHCVFLI